MKFRDDPNVETPMVHWHVDRLAVDRFWRSQDFDLGIHQRIVIAISASSKAQNIL